MDWTKQQLDEYLEALASKAPVPGGGGVSALAGALAAGLGQMVCSLTTGKKKYADVESEIQETAGQLKALSDQLCACMEEDARAFEPLSRAYGLPKNTPEELEARNIILEQCLDEAAQPPVHICELIERMVPLLQLAAEKGSRLAVSDAGCAAALAAGAMRAAALNIYVNTRLMKTKDRADSLNARTEQLLERNLPALEALYQQVSESLRA